LALSEKSEWLQELLARFEVERLTREMRSSLPEAMRQLEADNLALRREVRELERELESIKLSLRLQAIGEGSNDRTRDARFAQLCAESPDVQRLERQIRMHEDEIEAKRLEIEHLGRQFAAARNTARLLAGLLDALG